MRDLGFNALASENQRQTNASRKNASLSRKAAIITKIEKIFFLRFFRFAGMAHATLPHPKSSV
jgi:cell division protein FtsL